MADAKAKLVKIKVEQGDSGLLFATSTRMTGLFVTAREEDALRIEAEGGIRDLYAFRGQTIEVNFVMGG